jgi:hypothetical protein
MQPHHTCPQCGARVYRAHRDIVDRLRSLFVTLVTLGRSRLRRYTCSTCSWHGTLRTQRKGRRDDSVSAHDGALRVLAVIAVIGGWLLLAVLVATAGLLIPVILSGTVWAVVSTALVRWLAR